MKTYSDTVHNPNVSTGVICNSINQNGLRVTVFRLHNKFTGFSFKQDEIEARHEASKKALDKMLPSK